MSAGLVAIAIINAIAIGYIAWEVMRPPRIKGGYRSVSKFPPPPILVDETGEHAVLGREQIGEDNYLIRLKGGPAKDLYDWELSPEHNVETMCNNNTVGGGQRWYYRKIEKKDRPTPPSAKDYKKRAEDAVAAEQAKEEAQNLEKNAPEDHATDVVDVIEAAKAGKITPPARR